MKTLIFLLAVLFLLVPLASHAQTHQFCPTDATCTWTGPQTFNGPVSIPGNVSVGGTLGAAQIENFMSIFGAKCDGVTDDSAAWTSAMTKAAALGGLKLIFPVGKTCFFAAGITITQANVALDCAGGFSSQQAPSTSNPTCQLLFAAGNNLTGIDTTAGISASVSIKHLYVVAQAAGTGTGNGIHLTSNAPEVEFNRIKGFGNCGISVDSSGVGGANNPNFCRLTQNYSVLNKGDGFCFNGNTNGNTNVCVVEQNTSDTNGGWGFDLLATGTTKPSTNQFRANHCVGNTSGCINVNGSSNIFLGNYAEGGGGNGMTLAAGSSNNYVLNALFGGMPITDSGTLNKIDSLNCGVTLGTTNNNPCTHFQVVIAPVPGSAGTKVFRWTNGGQGTNLFDLDETVSGNVYVILNAGANPFWEFLNGTNIFMVEGTCGGGNATVDQLCPDSSSHRFKMNNNNGGSTTVAGFSDNLGVFASGGTITPALYASLTNCASSGGTCVAAPAGRVSIAAAATTVTVATTAVTANSEIILTRDNSLGTALSVTCNTQSSLVLGTPYVSARTAATSFVITIDVAPTTNPLCISYEIKN